MTEVFGGDVVGSAFVRIQPTIGDDFGQTLGTGIQRQVSRTGAGRIALSGDTSRLESDVGSAFDRIAVKGAAVLGGIFAVDKVTGWISQGFAEATLQKLGEVNAKALFGPQAQGIIDTAKSAKSAATETSAAFLTSTNQIGQFFGNIGLGGDKAASMAEQVATLAGQLSALNPNLGDAQTLTTGLLRAMETGQARALAPFGLTVKKSAIDAEALAHHLGTTSQNTADLALKTQHVTDLQQQLSDLQAGKGTASANQVAAAQDRVRLATGNQAKALAEHGASSNQYLSAHASLLSAEQGLSDVQGRGADNAKKVADTTVQLAKAKSDLADAAAKVTVTLTPEEQAQATLFAVLDQAAGVQDRYTAAVQAGALAAPQAQTAWDQALGDLGDRLLPKVSGALQDFTGWLDQHQQDFANAGDTIGNAFGKARDVFGWLIDHRGPIEGALGAIAAVWATDKVAGWGKDIFTVVRGLSTLDPKALEKLLPGLSGILGIGKGTAGTPTVPGGLGASVAQMSVGEMTVGSMVGGVAAGGGILPVGTTNAAGRVVASETGALAVEEGAVGAGLASSLSGVLAKGIPIVGGALIADQIVKGLTGVDLVGEVVTGIRQGLGLGGGDRTPSPRNQQPTGPTPYALQQQQVGADVQGTIASFRQNQAQFGGILSPDEAAQVALNTPAGQSALANATNDQLQQVKDAFAQGGALASAAQIGDILAQQAVVGKTMVDQIQGLIAGPGSFGNLSAQLDPKSPFGSALATLGGMTLPAFTSSVVATNTALSKLPGNLEALPGIIAGLSGTSPPGTTTPTPSGPGASRLITPPPAVRPALPPILTAPRPAAANADSSSGYAGTTINVGTINHNTTGDADPITAIQRGAWHATYDERGFLPSDQYPAPQQLTGTR